MPDNEREAARPTSPDDDDHHQRTSAGKFRNATPRLDDWWQASCGNIYRPATLRY